MSTNARPSARRILASVAIIGFAAGVAVAAWGAVDGQADATHAALFDTKVIDLRLNGPKGIDAFVGGHNMAPGDAARGVLSLSTQEPLQSGLADLDIGVSLALRGGGQGVHRLDDALVVTRLAYGRDDLLSANDGGRNAPAELDRNHDGRLTLPELSQGLRDLPPPLSAAEGGTGFSIEVTFQPRADASAKDFQGQVLDARFVFQLADALAPDI